MLAIFDGRVAKRPECLMKPHENAVSALKDDFLVNHFTSVYSDSVVVSSEAAFTFAYSLGTTSTYRLPRFHFAFMDNIFCMYQGHIEDIDVIKKDLQLAEIDDEAVLVIRAFQILKQLGQRVPKKVVEDMAGNCVYALYDSTSKFVVLAGGSYYDLPIYWGIDARFNLVISNNNTVVEKACGCFQPFISGQVYACCKGQTGLEAIFKNKQPEPKVDLTEKNTPMPLSVESVTTMILQADMDRSKPHLEYWQPPMENVFKVNTAAKTLPDGKICIGVIVRNSKGETELGVSRRKGKFPAMYAEVQAFMEGVYMAAGYKFHRCVFEMVHLNIEKDKEKMTNLVGNIAKIVVANLSEFNISFVTDSANKAANGLAKYARRNEHSIWEKETPECIASIVASERPDFYATTS